MKLHRRARVTLALLVLSLAATGLASADPYPVLEEPVLKSDTQWEKTAWGYKLKSLAFDTSREWPTVFTMEGYAGASRPNPNAYLRMDDGELMALRIRFRQGSDDAYAFVQASIRGTECSGGLFNLYDRRHAWDGHQIIEWIADQEWSNEKVGMYGSSYPGQTTYFTAATQPPSLKAVMPNLLHSDIYRDIFMPGGVQNYLFPTAWTYLAGPHRLPQDSAQNGTLQNDEICQQNQANRSTHLEPAQPQHEPAWAAIGSTDNDWYVGHAALTYAPAITIPYYQQSNWQDEQVGPRSVVLFDHINPKPQTVPVCDGVGNVVGSKTVTPKLFVNSNGDHGHGGFAGDHRWAWFDIWLRGKCDTKGLLDQQVVNYFEADENGNQPTVWAAKKSGQRWPFEDTQWTRMYLGEGSLNEAPPTGASDGSTYLSGVARQNWFLYAGPRATDVTNAQGLPDAVSFLSAPIEGEPLTIAGPIVASLYASMAGTDTDFFVSLSDVQPDGRISYLQRGLLKASHNAIDPRRSYYSADGQTMVQPYRPHTNPQPVMPGEVVKYDIEVFPLGHIFRPGHRLLVQVHTPPVFDGVWGYTPTHHQPSAVTILHDAEHPSSLLLPVVEVDGGAYTGEPKTCPVPGGFPCTPKSTLDQ